MKKITKQDYEAMPLVGRGRRSRLFSELLKLEIGEGLQIEPADWNKSYPPTQIARRIAKKFNRKFKGGKNLQTGGWAILRVG